MACAAKNAAAAITFVLAAATAHSPAEAEAGSHAVLDIATRYLACLEITAVERDRLMCFDGLLPAIQAHVDAVASGALDCAVTNLRFTRETPRYMRLAGEMSCLRGRLIYRIYGPDESFLGAGETVFDGYAFHFLYEIPGQPETLTLRTTTLPLP